VKRAAGGVCLENCAVLNYYAPSGLKNSRPGKVGPIGCPETSVRNYRYSLRSNPEERISHLLRGGSLKSRGNFVDCQRLVFECVKNGVAGVFFYSKVLSEKV
jgi:hypothetical protein